MLPAELRNYIYELAFTTINSDPVELLEAEAPSKDILLSCREIYGEARLLYRDAYRRYWNDTKSIIYEVTGRKSDDYGCISTLETKDLTHIQRLSLEGQVSVYGQHRATYEAGVWTTSQFRAGLLTIDCGAQWDELAQHINGEVLGDIQHLVLGLLGEQDREKARTWAKERGLSLAGLRTVMAWFFPWRITLAD